MRKIFLFCLVVMAFSFAAQAQSYKTALGLRMGDPFGFSFKTFTKSDKALELAVGPGYFFDNVTFTGYFEWQKPTNWAPNFDWYIGPGAHMGFWNEHNRDSYNANFLLGMDGIIGLEYTLDDVPLNFSMGVGPSINLTGEPAWFYWNGGLAVRFVF